MRLSSWFQSRPKVQFCPDLEAAGNKALPATPALTPSASSSADSQSPVLERRGLPVPRKHTLPASLMAPHAPNLFDSRIETWVPSRISLLSSENRRYLLSSTGAHSGSYGKLRLAVALDADEAFYVKVIRRQPNAEHTPKKTRGGRSQTIYTRSLYESTAREAHLMQRFGQLSDAFVDDRRFYLIMPFGRVSLQVAMGHRRAPADQQALGRSATFQLFGAAHFLHEQGIVHNDIKADNVLFDPHSGHLQLIDFGMVEALDPSTGLSRRQANYGSYPPPDRFVARGDAGRARPFDDLWAIAASMLHLLAATHSHRDDPLAHESAVSAGRYAYDRWQKNMRVTLADGRTGLDVGAGNPRIAQETHPLVNGLHRLTSRAFAADPALTLLLLSNVFDLQIGPLLDGKSLANGMWNMAVPYSNGQPLLDADRYRRGIGLLRQELQVDPQGEDATLIKGLRSAISDMKVRKALLPLLMA